MSVAAGPGVGLDPAVFTNVTDSPASRALAFTAIAASTPASRGGRPHKALGQGEGAAVIALVETVDISRATGVAGAMARNSSKLTGSNNGVYGIPPARGGLNGRMYLNDGIAVISGMRQK